MTAIRIEHLTRTFGAVRAVDNISLDHRAWRAVHAARAFRLRQDDAAAHDRRLHRGRIRIDFVRRPAHRQSARASPRHRHGVSELRDLSEPHRGRERRLRTEGAQGPVGRHQVARRQGARAGAPRRLWSALAAPALGRPAAARRHRARAGHRARGAAVRRAAVQSRRAAADRDAGRDPSVAAGARPDRDLCDA